jgi:hypothetical protein
MRAFIILILTILVWSCGIKQTNIKEEVNYIISYRIITKNTPNPDSHIFHIQVENKLLREALIAEMWDTVKVSGGHFIPALYRTQLLSWVDKTENPYELILGMNLSRFLSLTHEQKDSIAADTFKEVEINIWYKDEKWTLKPLEDSKPDWSLLKVSDELTDTLQ